VFGDVSLLGFLLGRRSHGGRLLIRCAGGGGGLFVTESGESARGIHDTLEFLLALSRCGRLVVVGHGFVVLMTSFWSTSKDIFGCLVCL
jgi:hypothetical protein